MDEKANTQRRRMQQPPCFGLAWVAAWLFTVGFLHLPFLKGVFAILLWPYYLGVHFSALVR